jgi:predicted  nucleic acid-binding Zn-ribbon protein
MTLNNKEYDSKLKQKGILYRRIGEYITSLVPIDHICLVCGTITNKPPKKVLAGVGCKTCSTKKLTWTNEEYDDKIKSTTYRRIEDYINNLTEIDHKCIVCGSVHKVRPASVLQGHNCKFCSNRASRTTEAHLEDIKGRSISCIGEYINNKTPIEYTCDVCGITWKAKPNNIVSKESGCPNCAKAIKISKGESAILEFIKSIYSGWIVTNDRHILEGKELDIVLPDLGLAFEFNGIYWHREELAGKEYHLNKTKAVEDFGYQLIHINEDEWVNKQDIVKSRIKSILGNTDKIGARKCTIREVSEATSTEFLNTNHIQGSCVSTHRYGMYLGDELVALMTFGIPRYSKDYKFELLRYCSILDYTVVGGASKLLKYFRSLNAGSIVSYSDRRWSVGKLYSTLGFKLSHNSSPNYRYYKGLKSLSRNQCQKHKLVELGYSIELTEKKIMEQRGYHAVYDSGNTVWVLQ